MNNMNQPTLFDVPTKQRRKPRKLMHVYDAGDCGNCHGAEVDVRFLCSRCGYKSEWMRMATNTDAKRGIPCPKCNELTSEVAK